MTLTDPNLRYKLTPGTRVKVTQQIAARNHTWTTTVSGTVVEYAQKQTGSWFAHAADDKLWLDRLVIKKDDGEISTLILDDYTHLEVDGPAGAAAEKKNESDLPV
jgi:hypothetical protein